MVSNTTLVNSKNRDLTTFGGRISFERDRLKFKQVDICLRLGISKTTQIKYESSERKPDVEYLAELFNLGFDVMYIMTGFRGHDVLTDEHQNLIEAYIEAPETLKRAAFAVLVSGYIVEFERSRLTPGYFKHEIKGEEDLRFEKHALKKDDVTGDD
ncbi:MAG TPA: helix-turn-helix transcriptional regulator [Methylotenera sp.]